MMIIAMQPSRNPHHHPHHLHNSSSWRSSSSFLPDDHDDLPDDDQGPDDVEQGPSSSSFGYIPHASLPSAAATAAATERPLSISASFLPPESSKRAPGTTTAAAMAASVPHQRRHQGPSGGGVSWLDQVAAVAAAASTSSSSGYLDDNSNVDAARRRQLQLQQQLHHQHQQQQQQRQREQLLDMYEQQQRRLDAEKLQLLHERQQAYLQQQQQQQQQQASARSSSYDDNTAAAAMAVRGAPPMTLRDALLPSFLHPQQQQRHPQQQLQLQPTLSSDEYLLTRQGLHMYPPAQQQPSTMLPLLPASYDGVGIHYQRSYESMGQWNPPLPASSYAVAATSRSASWGNDGDIVAGMGGQHRGLSTIDDEHNYHHGRYGPPTRGWMGTVGAASNNSPASDDGGDSGKIELDHDAPSIIRPVPDQIDFRAHKPGPDLESALVASLTGSHNSVGAAAVAAASGGDKSATTTAASVAFPSERANLDALTTRCETPAQATRVLRIIGSTLRSKADPFIDVTTLPYVASALPPTVNPSARSSHPATTSSASSSTSSRGKKSPTTSSSTSSSNTSFPEILHELLEMSDREQLDDIVSWLPHKRAFRINNKDRFMTEILPLYFKGQNRWSSFLRQLNLYGFSRVAKGTDYGAYYHELMIGGRPDLCQFMRRVGTPKGLDRRTYKLAEGDDPDFYAMPLVLGSMPYPPPPTMDPHHHHHHHHGRSSLPRHHHHDDDHHHHHQQHRHSSYRGL